MKPSKQKVKAGESHKETIAIITAENRAYFEKQEAKNKIENMPTMYICPQCNKECSVADELLEQEVSCPHCSNIFNAGRPKAIKQKHLATVPPINVQSETTKTKQAEALVEKGIKEKMNNVIVKEFNLVHLSGVKYKGTLTLMTAQGIENRNVDVSYDGDNAVWQVNNQEEAANQKATVPQNKIGFRIMGLLICIVCFSMAIVSPVLIYGKREYSTAKFIASGKNLDTTYNAAANMGQPQNDLSVTQNRQDIAQAQQSLNEIEWKKFIIFSDWLFGVSIGFWQLLTGDSFSELSWNRIIIVWAIAIGIGIIQRLT